MACDSHTPVTATNPADDRQCVPSRKKSPSRLVTQRVQKPTSTKGANVTARTLREQARHRVFKGNNESRSSMSYTAVHSDGFVGTELGIQSTRRTPRPKIINLNRNRMSETGCGGLLLAHGYLPVPLLQPCEAPSSVKGHTN